MVGLQPFVIGIAGGSGSGKSTLARELTGRVQPSLLVEIDWYYRDLEALTPTEREAVNFDHPDALDWALLRDQLATLRSGASVERPVYDFALHRRRPDVVQVEPAPLIIIEGILALHDRPTRDLMDLRVFVESPLELRRARRVRRDVAERGRSAASVALQIERTVAPMHRRFVEPTRRFADVLADGSGSLEAAARAVLAGYAPAQR